MQYGRGTDKSPPVVPDRPRDPGTVILSSLKHGCNSYFDTLVIILLQQSAWHRVYYDRVKHADCQSERAHANFRVKVGSACFRYTCRAKQGLSRSVIPGTGREAPSVPPSAGVDCRLWCADGHCGFR